VRDARLICICTPLNPTGTVMARDEVEAIGRLVVEENARRAAAGDQLDAQVSQALREGDKPGRIADANQRPHQRTPKHDLGHT
jgi:hypothetical protein